jgi:4-hydroxy-tetrahydrodipicolinate synthase
MKLHGIIPPAVTPMTADEEIDLPRLRATLDRLLAAGVHGLFVLGTTGEFYALDPAEKQAIIAETVALAAKRVPVVAGTGAVTTREAVRLTKIAEREEVDAVAVITPHFLNPSQQELFDHFRRVAESTRLPVLLYVNPSMTGGVKLDVSTVVRLSEVPNIAGMKDSAGNLETLIEYVRSTRPGFLVFQGRDPLIEPALANGAVGAVPSTANIAPHLAVAIYEAHRRGDAAAAREAQAKFSPLRYALVSTPPGGVKMAMNLAGVPVGPSRSPIGPLTAEQKKTTEAVLGKMGLMGPVGPVWKGTGRGDAARPPAL